jgi:hypothetical protein
MSRDLLDEDYCVSRGRVVPVKWTAPEVLMNNIHCTMNAYIPIIIVAYRQYTTRSTPLPVMCGALDVSCMRSGVSDTSRLKAITMLK